MVVAIAANNCFVFLRIGAIFNVKLVILVNSSKLEREEPHGYFDVL